MATSADDRGLSRNDLAWAISVGGIGTVAFATLLVATWYFAATLFLIFAGMLLGVALNAMTQLLGRVTSLPHSLRLAAICLLLAALLSGVIFLGGVERTAMGDLKTAVGHVPGLGPRQQIGMIALDTGLHQRLHDVRETGPLLVQCSGHSANDILHMVIHVPLPPCPRTRCGIALHDWRGSVKPDGRRVYVSRTRCGILHAAPQSRDRTKHRRSQRPRLCSAPLRKSYALRCVRGTIMVMHIPCRYP